MIKQKKKNIYKIRQVNHKKKKKIKKIIYISV